MPLAQAWCEGTGARRPDSISRNSGSLHGPVLRSHPGPWPSSERRVFAKQTEADGTATP